MNEKANGLRAGVSRKGPRPQAVIFVRNEPFGRVGGYIGSTGEEVGDLTDKELFETYRKDVYWLCYSMLRNGADAEDICQDTFVRAFAQDRARIDPVKPWLLRIAVNLCRTHLKRTSNGRRKERRSFLLSRASAAPGADEEAERQEAGTELDDLLRSLPERIREAMLLRYVGDLALSEIAEVLDIPLGTVKSRMNKGHGKVRQLLRDGGGRYEFKGVECVE